MQKKLSLILKDSRVPVLSVSEDRLFGLLGNRPSGGGLFSGLFGGGQEAAAQESQAVRTFLESCLTQLSPEELGQFLQDALTALGLNNQVGRG